MLEEAVLEGSEMGAAGAGLSVWHHASAAVGKRRWGRGLGSAAVVRDGGDAGGCAWTWCRGGAELAWQGRLCPDTRVGIPSVGCFAAVFSPADTGKPAARARL